MMHLEDASKVHEIVDKEVLSQDPKLVSRVATVPSLLQILVSATTEVASLALGDTGSRLRGFASAVEGSKHPDLGGIKDGILSDGHEFAAVSKEMVQLTTLATEANLSHVLPHLGKLVPKVAPSITALKEIDDPDKTLNFVRFVSSPERRDAIRRKKKTQTVNLQAILQKQPDQWGQAATSFVSLARNQMPFEEDIELCSRRARGMNDIGASGLANRMAERALEYRTYSRDRYYGFNRMTVTVASIIAGKILRCDLQPTPMRSHRIIMPHDTIMDILKAMNEENASIKSSPCLYEPRLYPTHEMEDLMSERTRTLIQFLEAFPEAGGCPIFDHYWCLVPSLFVLNIPINYGDWANEISNLTRAFDRAILKANAVPAVLLGEKDGKSFFVDYW